MCVINFRLKHYSIYHTVTMVIISQMFSKLLCHHMSLTKMTFREDAFKQTYYVETNCVSPCYIWCNEPESVSHPLPHLSSNIIKV